jgi:hypothetical protein
LGVSSSIKFNSFGATNFIGTSPNPSAFSSTSTTQGLPSSRRPTNKKK